MNYEKIYHLLIEKADSRGWTKKIANDQGIYVERHHIIPKCMGGAEKDPNNIVVFLPEEHFVAHQLLVKMFPNHYGVTQAITEFRRSSEGQVRNNKIYSWLKRKITKTQSEFQKQRWQNDEEYRNKMNKIFTSDEFRQKISDSMTPERRAINSKALKGKPRTEETKRKLSIAHKGKKHSEEHKRKVGLASSRRRHTEETKLKMREISLSKKNVICPHCGKEGKLAPMKRWHFNNCKLRRTI